MNSNHINKIDKKNVWRINERLICGNIKSQELRALCGAKQISGCGNRLK